MGLRMRFILLTLATAIPTSLLMVISTPAWAEKVESSDEEIRHEGSATQPSFATTLSPEPLPEISLTPIDFASRPVRAIAPPVEISQVQETPASSESVAPEPTEPGSPEPESSTEPPETLDEEALDETEDSTSEDTAESEETPEEEPEIAEEEDEAYLEWQQLLIEGDRLFLEGQYLEAEQRYQAAKDPDDTDPDPVERPEAFTDPELLSPAGRVYWREYQAGQESDMETRIFVPLQLLTEEHPEFVPAQVEYAVLLSDSEDEEAKQQALEQLEQATALFPENAQLARTRVNFLAENEEWLQAAIAARQFVVLNPDAPENPQFEADSEEYQQRFRSRLRGQLRRNAIGNAVTGALGFVLTGNLFGPLSALDTTILMLRGESAVGESIANRAVEELDLITDEEVVAYVNEIGQTLASLAGRDEFEYEFYVVEEEELNAFALPGGKVFVNAGAILRAETEAELAGLIAHELSHAVLSHGFQIVTGGNLTANVLQHVPYGGYVTNLAVLRYSRGMERQADTLGTQLLASSHYAADGLHRMMETLYEVSEYRSRFDWLSSHPDIPERIRRIDQLIDQNGYNRYAYEGIERHLQIREQVEQLLREAGKLESEEELEVQNSTDDPSPTPEESETEE